MNDHIASVCHKYGLDKEPTVNRMSVMVDKEHKVAFCRNAKVYSYVVQEGFFSHNQQAKFSNH